MKLKNLALHSLPGLRRGFTIADIHPGLNIIIGPNASGKTSICMAIRRLLWPDKVKHFLSASIHSEWSHNQDTFTIEVKDGNLIPYISQSGKSLLDLLPEEHLIYCFSMTIDELFDGKDQEFAQRIAREIAGGYDVEAAQRHFTPSIPTRTAIKEWKEAEEYFEKYKQIQDRLRQEGEKLPELERSIEDAEEATCHVSILEKIIKLKAIKNKITACENHLNEFPPQLIQSQIKATDWDNFQRLIDKQNSLRGEIESLQTTQHSLEKSSGKWCGIDVPEGECDRQIDIIQTIQRLDHKKNEIQSEVDKLESDLAEHRRLLGILSDKDIENIQSEYLDHFEEEWESLEKLNNHIEGVKAQLCLNSTQNTSSETYWQSVQLLAELASLPKINLVRAWIVTSITLAAACALFFSLADWMRLYTLTFFIPLGFIWKDMFQTTERHRQVKNRYRQLGLPLPREGKSSTILQQLNDALVDLGKARQIESQLQRNKELEYSLASSIKQQSNLHHALMKRAQAAGIHLLPNTRYRFASCLKDLHKDWMKLKRFRLELKQVLENLACEWEQWYTFADHFENNRSSNAYELMKVHVQIKNRINDAASLKKIKFQLENKQGLFRDIEQKIEQLLIKTDCSADPKHLQRLVEQLDDYQNVQSDLRSLKNQFEELASELGETRIARIYEEFELLEEEKREQEKKAKTLKELSEKNGSLKARIKQMESASEGDELLHHKNQKFEILRISCRDFAKKELMESLVNEAQKEFQRECQPPVLEMAIEWFQRFTKNKFKLDTSSNYAGSIVYEVIDTSTGERRTLDQLSRGTRMQLLMSIRLSFAFHNGRKNLFPPIFLDEVLANTDPERFDAIADLISELAASGQQIFYLTCNPQDASKWKQRCPNAHLIDLARIRGEQAFLEAPSPILNLDSRIPKSVNQSFDDYIKALKLPSMRINEPLEMVSVHYLVNNTEDLYRLLNSGIETYGNLMHVRQSIIEKGFPEGSTLISRRAKLLERFFDLRTRGRGRLVSRNALVAGGISKIFIDRIWEITQELGCDTKKLITFLEDKNKKDDRKKGLRTEDRDNLKSYFSQHGYLDERDILEDDEIRREFLPLTIEEEDMLFIEKLLSVAP